MEANAAGDARRASECAEAMTEAAPEVFDAWFEAGLHAKARRDWTRCRAWNARAMELFGEAQQQEFDGDNPAAWNLGIAATALGDWASARRAWAAYGITGIGDGAGEIQGNFGMTPIRLNPDRASLPLEVQPEYAGRNVAHFSASLNAGGKEVARFTAVAQREARLDLPPDLPGHPLPQAPRAVDASPAERFPFSKKTLGYQDLIESRTAEGAMFRGPSAVWFRMRYPLVAGEVPSALQRVAVAADSGNGISAILDFREYIFVNSDLTINLLRRAQGEWVCIDARTLLGPDGGGLAEARIFDARGLIGRSTQSLAIRRRE